MLTLIRNEFIKTFMRGKTWIVIVLLIGFCGLLTYGTYDNYKWYLEYNNPETQISNYKSNIEYYKDTIKETESDTTITDADKDITINDYNTYIKEAEEGIKEAEQRKKDIENGVEINYIPELKEAIKQNEDEIKMYEENDENHSYQNQLKLDIEELQYRIDNNINEPQYSQKFNGYEVLGMIVENIGMLFLPIGIMVFFSDMVSGEYTPATLKFLLVQPVSRRKVLMSKIITSVIVSVVLITAIELLYFVVIGAFTGFEGGTSPIAVGAKYVKEIAQDGNVQFNLVENSASISSLSSYVFTALLYQALFIMAATVFTVMISTIFKSSMITMAISIVVTVATFIITQLSAKVQAICHFIFLSFAQVSYAITGDLVRQFSNEHLTLNSFVIVMIATSIISYIIADLVFTKRDILI